MGRIRKEKPVCRNSDEHRRVPWTSRRSPVERAAQPPQRGLPERGEERDGYLVDSDIELGAVHLGWFDALYGIYDRLARHAELRRSPGGRRGEPPAEGAPRRSYLAHDLVTFAIATTVGALVSSGILYRFSNSDDEWANTCQADLFAHFKAYGTPPPCPGAFQHYWISTTWAGRSRSTRRGGRS